MVTCSFEGVLVAETGNKTSIFLPGHIHYKFLCSHCNFFENLLPTIFGNMVLGHHAIGLKNVSLEPETGYENGYFGMNDSIKKEDRE